jgi:DNA-binding beta-propeller fold protein YncE
VYRHVALISIVVFLALPTVALADGQPGYVMQGGPGVLGSGGKTRYVAVSTGTGTAIERIRTAGGAVMGWATLEGSWGIPTVTFSGQGEGLTRDGKRLVVAATGAWSPSEFAIVNTRNFRVEKRFSLNGNFAYDALSPDGSTVYLIQHVNADNINRYVVRAYDLRSDRLVEGRIADKSQLGWVMEGSPMTRATSADGRWVYTLYSRPGGYPFVHALDTVNGVAHCIGLPWRGDQAPMVNIRLAVAADGKTFSVQWKSGKPWLAVDTSNWRITHVEAGDGFPWRWLIAAAGTAIVVAFAVGLLLLARRRQPREALQAAL